MNISLRRCAISINTDNSITIETNFLALNGPNDKNYRIIFDGNSKIYLTTGKGITRQTISSGAVYNYIYQRIGNDTSKDFAIRIRYGSVNSNTLRAIATIPEYSLSMSASSIDTNSGGQTTNYETQSLHYVNEFVSENTYLQSWSKPRIDYLISSSTGALYGNRLILTGAITGSLPNLGTASLQLDSDFTSSTYSVEAGDGRKTTSASYTINRINWEQPSISINISRYNSAGRRIDWNLEGIWSYISNALQPNINFQLTYNNNTYTLYTKNNEFYWYDGTHLYKDTTGAEISSFDISTYSLGIPIEYPSLSEVSNITANGQFILVDENDYKYSINASAYLTDNIDYRIYTNTLVPSGLPAIYCHRDSNGDNLIDIYGDTNINGNLNTNGNAYISGGISTAGIYTTGNIDTLGTDIYFGTRPNTNDSGDIAFKYDNGSEKSRIWTDDTYSVGRGPNYRVYDESGNNLYSGRLGLENNYSTNEVIIGTWKGATLYRRIYEGYLNSSGTLDNDISVDGTIQRIEGYAYSIYANWWVIGSHYFPEPQYDSCFTIPQSSASFNIETNGYFNQNSKYVVIVEYTK